VARLVEVFREVKRVLRKDGTCWVNLGDSYNNYRPGNYSDNRAHAFNGERADSKKRGMPDDPRQSKRGQKLSGLKEKDLMGIPWRVAFALQDDGWYLRQDIIWHKPNPMPESATDRCTKAHEYLFLLTKSAKYWYDADAIREPFAAFKGGKGQKLIEEGAHGKGPPDPFYLARGGKRVWLERRTREECLNPKGRNKRSVWTITPKPYKGAHFATFPPELPALCIKAGCPVGGTVLDPFGGAGTAGMVANQLGRDCILIELNPKYVKLIRERLEDDAGLFADIQTEEGQQ